MADTTAAAAAAARERLAADLRDLGAALRLQAQSDLPPEVQELVSSWDLLFQALLDAADGQGGSLQGAEAAAAAALLQPLLGEAFAAAQPDLFIQTLGHTLASALQCCNIEALPCLVGPVIASLLGPSRSEQLDPEIRFTAAEALAALLLKPGCTASLLALHGDGGAAEALIAIAKRGGEPQQDRALALLAELAEADADTAERAASAEAALLPIAVERIRSAAADASTGSFGHFSLGPLRLMLVLTSTAVDAVRARAGAVPGLAGAAVDLLVALGAAERAAAQPDAQERGEMVRQILVMLTNLMNEDPSTYTEVFDALTSRGALPRVLALLRSPVKADCRFAACALGGFARQEAGADALFKVPRAASELAAALRRAYADGEDDPPLMGAYAAYALSALLKRIEAWRATDALARAAVAEGSTGSLLGALASLISASVCESYGSKKTQLTMLLGSMTLLNMILVAASRDEQRLRVLRRVPLLAEACVVALDYWQPKVIAVAGDIVFAVAHLAGFDPNLAAQLLVSPRGAQPPAATEDTAAARAALRAAPSMEGALRQCLAWWQREPTAGSYTCFGAESVVLASKWLLALPEVQAPAAPTPAGQASAASAAAPAQVPAAAAAGGSSAAAQPLAPEAGSGGSSGSGGGSGAEAAVQPRVCGRCGKSPEAEAPLLRCVGCKAEYYCGKACATAHWRSHRAACKAARAAAAQRSEADWRL
ncbi:hypothetical protein Rsub_11166 [Raphidocelis subcapitata]|uniref:MYND-type domain-containing protein n=1 Tax=Raphidocelis subcapitata TaxID=307507 RepID=A0A2V0PLN7_9CHLO|nr:hypothetical protein Rsub_11166 [Raphidocelis subcapitata]|eukprot:GBF98760.1 hypothetical protein Rsub_11166 [Raphidocelis subcapitata]